MEITHCYCSTYSLASIQQAATIPTVSYVIFNTNSVFALEKSKTLSVVNSTNVRVNSFKYKITAANTSQQGYFAPTNFTNCTSNRDAILTILPTQNTLDISNANQEEIWEQKHAMNHYLLVRLGGSNNAIQVHHGEICPEDYDLDPGATAGDETWTAIGSNPTQGRYLGILLLRPIRLRNSQKLVPLSL
ncbi:Aste57867_10437 [Aphanomyces stellatus]|uniref:Aste57867_10437 protein n=1 Tax=Aphanomyces stellatus TaxID=120398 RepID=A0A485KQC3_9STRA|nr:hypothetical protein As57867_010397 [Aphanomyces stellatus]VFT87311.1 Aste57867_10437 [Aphanomyces stellatus]